MHSFQDGKRDVHIGVMVTPAIGEKLEQAKSGRRGIGASKSAVVHDILVFFFAQSDTVVDNVLNGSISHTYYGTINRHPPKPEAESQAD